MITRRSLFGGFAGFSLFPFAKVTQADSSEPMFLSCKFIDLIENKQNTKVFSETFPQGCYSTVENIQKLINNGFDFEFDNLKFLITGKFKFKNKEVWYKEGKLHREDGPAVIHTNGDQYWYKEGKIHREDGPAVIRANGDQIWYKEGRLHREDGPAVIRANGDQEWRKEGRLHREDGPAVIYDDGDQEWRKEGRLHREDGPAIIYANGDEEWWEEGKCFKRKVS